MRQAQGFAIAGLQVVLSATIIVGLFMVAVVPLEVLYPIA